MKNEFDKVQKELSEKIQLRNTFHEESIKIGYEDFTMS